MRYTTLLLDWDGCLADTLGVWMQTYLSIYKEYGIEVTPEEVVQKSWGNTDQGPINFGISDNEKCWNEIVAKVKVNVEHVPLHQNSKELLQQLKKRGVKTAIVTSSERQIVQPALDYHKLNDYIDYMVTDSEVSNPKPDPEMLNKAMIFLGSKKSDTLIVGDTAKDIVAGKNADIATGLVLHQLNKKYYDFEKLKESEPTHIFSDLIEIVNFI